MSQQNARKISEVSSAPAEDVVLSVRDVTVAYRSYKERPTTIKESLLRFIKHGQISHYSTFDALSNVSFDIRRGSVFGLIGSNGSGKSTLLKVMAGVLSPTKGTVDRKGTIASLIELGAGFDPELNAIENIYLYCSLHGKSRNQIRERVPHVLEFAELNDFATTPVKYYSSGMFARLGFSVAIDIDPDILLVDEILAVGDERFQNKCLKVFDRFLASGKTIVMVTHALQAFEGKVDQALLLSRGRVLFDGDPKRALEMYRDPSYQTMGS